MSAMRVGSALAALLVVLAGCGGAGPGTGGTPADGSVLLGRTFLSTAIMEDGTAKTLVPGTRISLSFPEKGKIGATAGCNHLFGTVAFDSDKLGVSEMGGTDMGCDQARHAQDEWLTAFLTAKPVWALNGDELVLTGAKAEMKLTDRKVAEPGKPLQGTMWTVESLIDGQTAASIPGGAQASLTFADGKVTGNTGCNRLTGSAVPGEGTVTFSGVATTKMLCPGDLDALERAVMAVLDGSVMMKIDGNQLQLTHPSGKGLTLRATT